MRSIVMGFGIAGAILGLLMWKGRATPVASSANTMWYAGADGRLYGIKWA